MLITYRTLAKIGFVMSVVSIIYFLINYFYLAEGNTAGDAIIQGALLLLYTIFILTPLYRFGFDK